MIEMILWFWLSTGSPIMVPGTYPPDFCNQAAWDIVRTGEVIRAQCVLSMES